ncbi:Vesicle transport v-SNARE protein vti1 [Psilocybe cubensis]|uniref:Vesicle transport v-SNARE protein vti1 n=2 Tax=Psilocybe cubensis TaxID=181762 RepID=A0ACB8GJW6_PSICU|nr:Vesicle transport v-SNARE protein vti1 [Psilocybe cubensis]KAH9475692.1 Vesicle transport v-SNARE protein vti1 [Psilocybe cubensis]
MDNAESPTAMFDAYELDFRHIISSISAKLEGPAANGAQVGEQRKAALRKVEVELDEADDIISQLEIEIQGIPQSLKPPFQARLKAAKADLTRYKRLSKEQHAHAARGELLSRSSPGPGRYTDAATSDDPYGERARLLQGTETLDEGSRRIKSSTGVALETEAYGADILRSLRGQREQIENSRNLLGTADTNIERASGTLKKMIRQMYKQRVLLSVIGVFFIILVLVILYFKIFRH